MEIVESNLDVKGTVLSYVGQAETSKVQYLTTNIAGEKRIMLRIFSKENDGTFLECLLSEALTKQYRANQLSFGNIMMLQYAQNTLTKRWMIVREQGTWVDVLVSKMHIEAMKVEEIDFDKYIVL